MRRWLAGFSEYNVFFCIDIDNKAYLKEKQSANTCIKPFFIVQVPSYDVRVVHQFRKLFKSGKFYNTENSCYLVITDLLQQYDAVCKFYNGTKLLTSYRVVYEKYRYIVFKLVNDLTEMNIDEKREYFEQYIQKMKSLKYYRTININSLCS